MLKEILNYKILKQQKISEKTLKILEKTKYITFKVHTSSNKKNIKNAIEKIFKVKVMSINIINVKGKRKKFKNTIGKRSNFKKAMIKLKKGYEINFNELE